MFWEEIKYNKKITSCCKSLLGRKWHADDAEKIGLRRINQRRSAFSASSACHYKKEGKPFDFPSLQLSFSIIRYDLKQHQTMK